MAGRGETIKYVIDADVSEFIRGLLEADVAAKEAGKNIDSSLSRTAKSSQNNFADIRKGAQQSASSIRNFGVAFQGLNITSAIIAVTALTGAALELGGALAAAASTATVLPAIFAQGGAAAATYKTGVAGLADAFTALQKGDPKAFQKSLSQLGPAASQVAFAFGGLLKAFNGVRLNTQNALFSGIGQEMLNLGSQILPLLNTGFQQIGSAINGAFKELGKVANTPLFKGVLSTIFSDTASNIKTLTGAIQPLANIFAYLYLITRPYVALLAQYVVTLTNSLSAFLSSAKGQTQLNTAIQVGVLALKELASFVGAAFGLLSSIFKASATSGNSLIATLTGLIRQATAFVNSADGQAKLAALFQFTSLAVQTVGKSLGQALNAFLSIIQIVNQLSPGLQRLIVGFLASALTIRPLITYVGLLFSSLRVLAIIVINVAQQAVVFFGILGGVASVVLLLGAGLFILGNIIRGPLGAALVIVGGIMISFVALNFLLGYAANLAAAAMFRKAQAAAVSAQFDLLAAETSQFLALSMYGAATGALAAGGGLTVAARGAQILQASLLPLLVLGSAVLVILYMLGVLGGGAKKATSPVAGLGKSLGGLNKSLGKVGTSAGGAATGGLADLNQGLNDVGQAADTAQKGLAGFDKMNVLADKTSGAGAGGLGAIGGLPSLPDLGSPTVATPQIDTGDFLSGLDDMQSQFDKLNKSFGKGLFNPFKTIADFLTSHPGLGLAILVGIILAIAAAFIFLDVAAFPVTLTITLIGLAILAIIAIAILLYKNWDTVTAFIKSAAQAVGDFLSGVFDAVKNFVLGVVTDIGNFFVGLWQGIQNVFSVVVSFFQGVFQGAVDAIKTIWNVITGFFTTLFEGVKTVVMFYVNAYIKLFQLAWEGIKLAFSFAVDFFKGIWEGISGAFGAVVSFFGNIFSGAWSAIKNAFSGIIGFFQGLWNNIVSIFGSVGTSIGDAIGGAVKSVINTVLNTVSNIVNTVINTINGAINLINKLPGVNIGKISAITLPRLAKGGVVTSSTFAEIGENGAEAVVPLENNTEWIDKLANKINAASGGSGNQPLNVTVELDGTKLGQIIIDRINEKTQMSGRNQVIV